jgi:hypothetical protein
MAMTLGDLLLAELTICLLLLFSGYILDLVRAVQTRIHRPAHGLPPMVNLPGNGIRSS